MKRQSGLGKRTINAGKGKHDCAKKVEHAEFGEGNCIHGQHAAPDENGNIAWYDVMFEHGVVKGVPITELNVLVGRNASRTCSSR